MALTPKQEAFALAYVETGNASEAYRRAYNAEKMKPETVNKRASELMANGEVAGRLGELRKPAADACAVTLEGHLRRLAELCGKAEEEGKYSAAVAAEIARGKAAGLYVERTELTGKDGAPIDHSLRVTFE